MQVRRTRALHRPIAERWMQRCREKCVRLRQNRTIQRYPREPCRAPNDPARASKTRAEIQYLFFFFFFYLVAIVEMVRLIFFQPAVRLSSEQLTEIYLERARRLPGSPFVPDAESYRLP